MGDFGPGGEAWSREGQQGSDRAEPSEAARGQQLRAEGVAVLQVTSSRTDVGILSQSP